jgi:predicted ATP-grasp superfamily ATP-dependent carboligase
LGQACEVFVTDCNERYIAKYSNTIKGAFKTPPPRFDTERYISALIEIIHKNKIELVIPTCEEIFYISKHYDRLREHCAVFAIGGDTLTRLHNKLEFAKRPMPEGVSAPYTKAVNSRRQIADFIKDRGLDRVILKPAYSRFSAKTMLIDRDDIPEKLSFDDKNPLIAQEYVEGEQLCTYTIACNGEIKAFSAYQSPFSIGLGTCITFASSFDERVFSWVSSFVKELKFTGQLSFDFIIGSGEEPKVIECNPRLTSGIHLFSSGDELLRAITGEREDILFAQIAGRKLTMPLLLSLPGTLLKPELLRKWAAIALTFKGIIYDSHDKAPFFKQPLIIAELAREAFRRRISFKEAATYDIEWNGAP